MKVLTQGYSQTINGSLNISNQLMVIMRGNSISLFVNGQFMDIASDTTIPTGGIGVFAYDSLEPTEAAFNNAQIWKL